MSTVTHLLKFIGLAVLGYVSLLLLFALGISADLIQMDQSSVYLGGGIVVSVVASITGAVSVWKPSNTLLLVPFVAPLLYSIAVMIYFWII